MSAYERLADSGTIVNSRPGSRKIGEYHRIGRAGSEPPLTTKRLLSQIKKATQYYLRHLSSQAAIYASAFPSVVRKHRWARNGVRDAYPKINSPESNPAQSANSIVYYRDTVSKNPERRPTKDPNRRTLPNTYSENTSSRSPLQATCSPFPIKNAFHVFKLLS
jgi:hypothetical protein